VGLAIAIVFFTAAVPVHYLTYFLCYSSGIGFGVGLVIAIVFFFAAIPQLIHMKSDFALTCGLFKRHCLKKKNQEAEEEEDLKNVRDEPVIVYREPAQEDVQGSRGSVQMEVIDKVL
jgi:hypothetical protein